jgi:hypothetical protein
MKQSEFTSHMSKQLDRCYRQVNHIVAAEGIPGAKMGGEAM